MSIQTILLPAGHVLTVTAPASHGAKLYRMRAPGAGDPYTPAAISAGASSSVGPFAEPRTYAVDCEGVPTTALSLVEPLDQATDAEVTAALAALSTAAAGTAADGVVAAEAGDAVYHRTTLTVDTVLPAIAGGADLAVGVLAYTFPAGRIVVHAASIDLAITQTEDNITADTPDIGLGTTIASGAVAVLGGTAAFENILTGQTMNDCDGTAELKTVATTLVIEAADDHTVHINVADGWAADGDAAAELAGTVVLVWSRLN